MLGGSTSLPMAQEESHGPRPRVHISLPQALSLTDISSGITLVPGSITQLKLHDSPGRQQSVQGSFPTSVKTLPKTTQGPDTKTLRSMLLLHYLQLDCIIPAIHGADYAARFSPRSECCNAPISMRAVMDAGGYLCMTIL